MSGPEHYAYCRDPECGGCLPTDEELAGFDLLPLFAEMLARCIPQRPTTKTHAGALAVIIDQGDRYRELAADVRRRRVAAGYWGPPPIPEPS